jgi:hypothetical protein
MYNQHKVTKEEQGPKHRDLNLTTNKNRRWLIIIYHTNNNQREQTPHKKKLTNLYHKQYKWLTKEPMKWIGAEVNQPPKLTNRLA